MTLQALSESNRRLWLEAMDGKEPVRNSASFKYSFYAAPVYGQDVLLVPKLNQSSNGALSWWKKKAPVLMIVWLSCKKKT